MILTSVSPEPKKFIVTGGAGFIGSHLVEDLLLAQHEVVVLDDLSTGMLTNLPKHPLLKFVMVDITNTRKLEAQMRKKVLEGASGVFHLAAKARIQPSIYDPRKTFEANAIGTFNILEMMRILKIPNMVYSASSSSYGLANRPPLRENMPANCLNPYSVTKLIGEELCKTYGNCFCIHNVCLKYFNVYGPRSPLHLGSYSPVIGLFFKQALQDNDDLTVVGDGQQKRDFTHVNDVVRANILAMNKMLDNNAAMNFFQFCHGRTFNIGSGANFTIKEVAQKVKILLKDIRPELAIKHIDVRPGEARETLADISSVKRRLGWEPKTSLDEALRQLKPYYMELFNVR
jgi:UDP-glucose 4-epimerase